jgi:hypothetical protein
VGFGFGILYTNMPIGICIQNTALRLPQPLFSSTFGIFYRSVDGVLFLFFLMMGFSLIILFRWVGTP